MEEKVYGPLSPNQISAHFSQKPTNVKQVSHKFNKSISEMLFRSVALLALVASANGQAVAPADGCLVCGPGEVVTNPDAIFSFPMQPDTQCALLQTAGLTGLIPLDQCVFLPGLITVCGCMPGDLPASPSGDDDDGGSAPAPSGDDDDGGSAPAPGPSGDDDDGGTVPPAPSGDDDDGGSVPAPSGDDDDGGSTPAPGPSGDDDDGGAVPAPTPAGGGPPVPAPVPAPVDVLIPCPAVSPGGCNVCPDGFCVSSGNAIFAFPGQPAVQCAALEAAGFGGIVPLDDCAILNNLIIDRCQCNTSPNGTYDAPPVVTLSSL